MSSPEQNYFSLFAMRYPVPGFQGIQWMPKRKDVFSTEGFLRLSPLSIFIHIHENNDYHIIGFYFILSGINFQPFILECKSEMERYGPQPEERSNSSLKQGCTIIV
jgi:hypothetical protein